jgi:hypothetical protein
MSKIKPGERQRTPYLTDAGMYRKKPPRRKYRIDEQTVVPALDGWVKFRGKPALIEWKKQKP